MQSAYKECLPHRLLLCAAPIWCCHPVLPELLLHLCQGGPGSGQAGLQPLQLCRRDVLLVLEFFQL